ncbi:MAG: hypothetical protein QXJ17_08810 [Nitrososphaeria archaeon]
MLKRKTPSVAIALIAITTITSYLILYANGGNTENLSLDLYELHTTIDKDGVIKYRATVRADNFFGDNIKINHLSFSINDTVLNYESIDLLRKNNLTYILINGTTANTQLKKAVEEFNMLNVAIKVEGRNDEGVAFQGSYNRVIKLYYHTFGTNTYYFTKFDIFGING